MVAAIIDKTVLTNHGQEHVSLTWILNNGRFSKTSTKLYDAARDYFGFFPLEDERFRVKGLERYSSEQINQISSDADLVYFTDTYGIYKNEWYRKGNTERYGIIYGGMSKQDIQLLNQMKERHKLILSEFNTIGSPTSDEVRKEFEELFKLHWTGWIAGYFSRLDTVNNEELPLWLINNYKRNHRGNWPFRNAGIVFVSNTDKVVILEDSVHVTDPMPYVKSETAGKTSFNLPESIKYPFWFDVIIPDTEVNTIAASFDIRTNEKGREELRRNGIPGKIPAVIFHKGADYRFYYFSGNFCDNPVSMSTSYFKGISFFKSFLYSTGNQEDRSAFFWEFYQPMMKSILDDYYEDSIEH
jgi:hypothetical protein